jgi:hypothetical protein
MVYNWCRQGDWPLLRRKLVQSLGRFRGAGGETTENGIYR